MEQPTLLLHTECPGRGRPGGSVAHRNERCLEPGPPRLEAQGERNAPLTIDSFAINTDQLEIKASGKGRVQRNGSTVTRTNFLETLNKNPVLSTLFTTANLALIGWAGRMLFGRKKPAEAGSAG